MGILPMPLDARPPRHAIRSHPPAERFPAQAPPPGAREHGEAFAFVRFGGPPTNNHAGRWARSAERTLRPLVIFRKVCPGKRSATGSENVAIFASVVETAKLRGCCTLDILEAPLTDPPETAREITFPEAARAG